ncbi:MAG: sigma-54-dependent Fis family transcriptional regulator [Deltaproteobacteria bacterium]|nr:sigma-54-dependent Fis family transcriptional regulator [Deltaproteobacteria bacterium]
MKVLVIDDDPEALYATIRLLERRGYVVSGALSGDEGIAKLRENPNDYGIIILDYRMEGKDGAKTAKQILAIKKELYILIHSADTSQAAAVNTWHAGAVWFIPKSEGIDVFLKSVEFWKNKYEEEFQTISVSPFENETLIRSIGMVGRSSVLAEIANTVSTYHSKQSTATVLILGESGTGKDLIARAFHNTDQNSKGPFVPINCAAIAEHLVESELFGHEKGSFTGAHQKKIGKFQLAGGGTLFLDEIGDMSPPVQAKLLRAIQEKVITPIGALRDIPVDVRVIAATNVDLERAVREKRFREDLYYRLKSVVISVPPLRARPEDIEPLVAHFSKMFNKEYNSNKSFLVRTVKILAKYSWPGNIRELKQEVEKLIMLSPQNIIRPKDLHKRFTEVVPSNSLKQRLGEITREQYLEALSTSKTLREAARKLAVPFSSFRGQLIRFGISHPRLKGAA